MKRYLAMLDQAAARVNALLTVIAIGLGVLDMTVLVGKGMMAALAENVRTMDVQISGSRDAFPSFKTGDPTAPHF